MSGAYSDAWAAVNRLIREGKSWSGREPDTLYLNTGDGSFADISFASGAAFPDDARALAPVDWDGDGDLDLWIANRTAPKLRFLRNDAGNRARHVAFQLRGTSVHRDAVGARIDLRVGAQRQVQLRQAGSGYLSQRTSWLTFGVGQAERIDEVVVRWPDGSRQRFEDVPSGARYRIEQGVAQLIPVPTTPAPRLTASSVTPPAQASSAARIALAARRPLPELALNDAFGVRHVLGGKPVLVNFWSSTCATCIAELRVWQRENARWKAAGLTILALSVDAPEAGSLPPAARELMRELGPDFAWGAADDGWLALFETLQSWIVDRRDELRVPSSFLVDAQRRLTHVYRGPASAEQLARDVAAQKLDGDAFEREARVFPGRRRYPPSLPGLVDMAGELLDAGQLDSASFFLEQGLRGLGAPGARGELRGRAAAALTQIGNGYLEAKRPTDAIRALERALEYDATDGARWFTLGEAQLRAGRKPQALAALRRSTELAPELAVAWLRLGSLLTEAGEPAKALAALERATALAPDDWRGWFTLGGALLSQQRPADALPHFRKSTELNSTHGLSWTGLGTCLAATGDRASAVQALEKALALDPRDQRAAGLLRQLK